MLVASGGTVMLALLVANVANTGHPGGRLSLPPVRRCQMTLLPRRVSLNVAARERARDVQDDVTGRVGDLERSGIAAAGLTMVGERPLRGRAGNAVEVPGPGALVGVEPRGGLAFREGWILAARRAGQRIEVEAVTLAPVDLEVVGRHRAITVKEYMRRFAALPWRTKTGSLAPPARCGPRAAGVFAVIGWWRAGRKVHSCGGVPAAVAVTAWTVRGRSKEWRWSPLPGTPRCRCVRVCQSPVLIRGPGRRRACSHPMGGLPLQEVASSMKVMYERVAGIDVHKDMTAPRGALLYSRFSREEFGGYSWV